MTRTLTELLQSFRKVFDGELITSAEQATYDTVRALWNTEIDRRPAVIARCVNRSDVVAAVNFAREQELEIAVRCGSHNAAGTAACDDGLMIDLSLMRSVAVEPSARRVRVAGGALLGGPHRRRTRTSIGRCAAAAATSGWSRSSSSGCTTSGR
jgi:FAD/FMN-containing dehydrogenase